MRLAATNFANNTAQGFVQQSLPQMLLGGHWLTEKFQFLSTLAWQTGDNEGGVLGELDLVVPLYGTRNASGKDQTGLFLQPGLVSWEADNGYRRLDVNVGLVYRQLVRERIAVGASVFYDHNIDSNLQRIGAGADVVSPYTYFSLNYYHPLNSWRAGERLGYEERALRGIDINIEQALLDSDWVVEASGGYWKGYDADNRKGEWQLAGSVGLRYYLLDYLSLYADYAYQHDDVDTERFAAGIEFSYPGKNRGVSTNELDLWRPVKREKRILYAEREIFPARIGFTSTSESLSINLGEEQPYTPAQLQFTVAIDRALAADLEVRFDLLINDAEVPAEESAERLKNGGVARIQQGQTQAVITYTRTDLDKLFTNPSEGDRYILRLKSASLKLPSGAVSMDSAILPRDSGGQVTVTVGEVTSQLQVAALDAAAFRNQNQELVSRGDVQIVSCPSGEASLQCFNVRRPSSEATANPVLNVPIRPGAFNGEQLTASFTTNSTAVANIDYRLQITTLTWTADEANTYKYIRIEILPINPNDDDPDAEMEYFRILVDLQIDGEDVDLPGCTNRNGRQVDACLRVDLSRPPTLTLAEDPATVAGGGDISLLVTSDIDVAGTLTLPLTISGQVVADDFTNGLTQMVTANFNGGKTATVTIETVRDADAAETYTVMLDSGSNFTVGNDAIATGTITAAIPNLTLATDPSTVVAGEDISLVVTSDIAVAGTLTVPLIFSDRGSTGITAGDFTNGLTQSVSADFNGTTTATVTLGTIKDADTAAETYTVTLDGGTGYTVGNDNTAAGAINAIPPTLMLADDPADVVAGNSISLVITSDINVVGSLELPLTISGQVAAADFTANALSQTVRANFNGSSTATVSIATVKDADADETYTITLDAVTSGSNYTVGSDNTSTGTIRMAMPALTLINDPTAVVAGNDISLTITSDITVAGTLTVPLMIGGQVAASDFTGNTLTPSVSANFAGNRTATVTIATEKDGDADETYTITLATGGTGYTLGDDTTATGTINAVTPTLTLETPPAGVQAGENISLVVTSDVAVTGAVTLSLVISAGAGSPTVVADDFPDGLNQSVDANFNGSTTATVLITTAKDGDPSETYRITLDTGSGYTVGSEDSVNSAISRLPPTLSLADPDAVVAGNDISLTVTSDIAVAGTLMLPLTIADRAASGIDANDFSSGLTQTVSANFDGSTIATVTIGTEKDSDTATETYTITLGSSGMDYTVGSPAMANGAITAAMPILTLADDPADAVAGTDISLTITSDVAITGMVTLALTFDGQVTAADLNGNTLTQMVDADFSGTTSATVTIATVKDGDSSETYTITLGTGSNYTVGGDNTAAGTITAATPELTFENNPAAIAAGENISLTITSDIAVAGTLMVPLTFGGQVVAADLDGNTLTQMVAAGFGGGKTATLLIGTERDGDPAETYTIALGGGSGYTVGSNRTVNGTINAATPTLTLETALLEPVTAGEDILLEVTSDIDIANTLTVRLNITSRSGDALTAADFNPSNLSQFISIDFSGGKTATATISAVKDSDTTEESFFIVLTSGTGYTVGRSTTSIGAISPAIPTLTLATSPNAVVAGNEISLIISSDIDIVGTLTVPLTITDRGSSNITADDFSGGGLTRSVSANFGGGKTATVTIGTVRDGDNDETYTIMLAMGGNGYTVGSLDTVNGMIIAATPELTLENNPATVSAGNGISLIVTSDISITRELTLSLIFSGDIVASDITDGLTQNVAANFSGTMATVTIGTESDGDSSVEDYTITLNDGTGYTVGIGSGDNTATGMINPVAATTPTLTLAADPENVAAGEDISLTITSDIAVTGALMVPLTIADRASSGIDADDFTDGLTQTISANFNNTTTATVTIGTVRDGDSAETYTITLGVGTGYTIGSSDSVNGTITAVTPELTLENDPEAVTAGNSISLVVTSDISITRALTLSLIIADRSSSGITGTDFTGGLTQSVSANFNGSTTATVMIGTVRDGDSDETYTITLGSAGGYTVGSDNTADGTIDAATPELILPTDPVPVVAGDDISLTVRSNIAIAGTLPVSLTLSGEIERADFTGGLIQSVSANFNGSTTATVMIGTVRDGDSAETYTITLGVGTGYTRGNPNAVNGAITAATPELTLEDDLANAEAGSDISLTITSDIDVTGTLMVPISIADRASSGITAADFSGSGLTRTVSASFGGGKTTTVTIGTERDGDIDETYTIMLATGGTGYTIGISDSVNGTITAATPELTLENNPAAVTAGNDISLLVTSDISITRTLTLSLAFGGDVVASDITGGLTQNVTANFSGTMATVTIGTANDSDSSAEDYTITLNTGTGYTVGIGSGDNTATGTINPVVATTPTLTLATNPADVAAGEDISLAITSDTVITSTVTVVLTLGGEVAAADITGGLSQTISANFNGSTSATVMIETAIDSDNADENYTITLNAGTGYIVGSPNAVNGTINAALPELTLETDPEDVVAGEDITLTITSDRAVTGTVPVSLILRGEFVGLTPPASSADFVGGLSQTVNANFNGGTTATITVKTVREANNGTEEYYSVNLGDRSNYRVGEKKEVFAFLEVPGNVLELRLESDQADVIAGENISLIITADRVVPGILTLPLEIRGERNGLIPAATEADFANGFTPTVNANFNGGRTATVTVATVRDTDTTIESYSIGVLPSFNYKSVQTPVYGNIIPSGAFIRPGVTLTLETNPAPVTGGQPITLVVTSSVDIPGALRIPLIFSDRDSSGFSARDFFNEVGFGRGLTLIANAYFNGGKTARVQISTFADNDLAAETYTITLGSSDSYQIGTNNSVDGVVNPALVLSLRTNPADVVAGEDIALIISANQAIFGTLEMDFRITGIGSNPVTNGDFSTGALDGDGENFLITTRPINFNGTTTGTLNIGTILDTDTAPENYQIEILSGVASIGGRYAIDVDNDSVSGTINPPSSGTIIPNLPTLTLATDPATVTAGQDITFVIHSDNPVSGSLPVILWLRGDINSGLLDNLFSGPRFTRTGGQIVNANFNGSTTAMITFSTERVGGNTVNYTINLVNSYSGDYIVGSDSVAMGTINLPTPTLTFGTDSQKLVTAEGSDVVLSVFSDIPILDNIIPVKVTLANVSGSSGITASDFRGGLMQTYNALFQNNANSRIVVSTTDDSDTNAETYSATLVADSNYMIGDLGMVTGTINPVATLTLATNPSDVVAGEDISLTITSDGNIAGAIIVPLTFSGQVMAADLNDNTLTHSVIANFNGGKTAAVTIGTIRDGDDSDETYTITLNPPPFIISFTRRNGLYIVGSDNTADGVINPR